MKILSILFLVTLLTMTMGCGSQVTSASKSTIPLDVREEALWDAPIPDEYYSQMLNFEIQVAELREELEDLDARLTKLEEKVIESPLTFESLWNPESLEARIKILEDKVLVSFSASPYPPIEDKITKLEKRVAELEKELGINHYSWP